MDERVREGSEMTSADATERIMIVDDDHSMRIALVESVRRLGYVAEGVGDGLEALEHVGRFQPWLVLTDLKMPRMSGLEVIKARASDDDRAHDGVWDGRDGRRSDETGCERLSAETVLNGFIGASHRQPEGRTRQWDGSRSGDRLA
jgi:PleD family two-component response regulator